MNQDSLITVGSYIDPIQAHIASGRLESEGIPVIVADEHYIWANWMLSNALGGVKVQVPTAYAEEARQILSDLDHGKYALREEYPQRCPRCESKDIKPLRTSWKLAFLGLIVLHIPIPFRRDRMKCHHCGNTWSVIDKRQKS
jgi:hypothetical protein